MLILLNCIIKTLKMTSWLYQISSDKQPQINALRCVEQNVHLNVQFGAILYNDHL